SARTKNHTGTLTGWPSGRTVVSHAIRLLRNRSSTCWRRPAGRCDVRFMETMLPVAPGAIQSIAPGRPGSPPADDRPGHLRDRAVVPVDHPGRGLPDRRPAAGARHGHLRGHRRRVHHAADPPVPPDRATAAGLGAPTATPQPTAQYGTGKRNRRHTYLRRGSVGLRDRLLQEL